MQKVDIAIAVLGAVAIISTGLGIGLYDDGNISFAVTTDDTQTFSNSAETVPAGGLVWEHDVPVNGYDATGTITIDWSGTNAAAQQALSGNVDVTVEVTGPNGVVETLDGGSFDFDDLSGTIDFSVTNWLDVPEDFQGTEEEAEALAHSWNSPLHIEITIQGPQGSLPTATQDDPVYTAAFDGNWHTYAIVQDTPDLETL